MDRKLRFYILLIGSTSVLTKEPDLPLCPTNFQYLPQNLPMHCRMPPPGHQVPSVPLSPPYFPGPDPGKPSENSQIVPVPPLSGFGKPPNGFPQGTPPGFPPAMPPGFPLGAPGFPQGIAMPPGMPMPMPMPGAPPSAKLPVIVMPFYSPDPSFKGPAPNLRPERPRHRKGRLPTKRGHRKNRNRHSDTSSDDETDSNSDSNKSRESSESENGWWSGRRAMRRPKKNKHHKKKQELLTPILQYVTKDGYVIFEKKISKGEAKDWLARPKNLDEEVNTRPEVLEPDAADGKSEEDDPVTITEAPQTTTKVQVKIQKNTNIKRFHHKHNLIKQPITKQE